MSTWEIPGEPDRDELWGPTADGEGWKHYVRDPDWLRISRWNVVDDENRVVAGPYIWLEVIQMGPITDEDPDPPLEVLAAQVVEATLAWETERRAVVTPTRPGAAVTPYKRASDALQDAVHRYKKKKGTT